MFGRLAMVQTFGIAIHRGVGKIFYKKMALFAVHSAIEDRFR